MKTFTVAELADSIEKNGLPQIKDWFFQLGSDIHSQNIEYSPFAKGRKITGACAVGQASINLSVTPGGWRTDPNTEYPFDADMLAAFITDRNDSGASYKEVANAIRTEFSKNLETVIYAPEYNYSPYLENVS